MSTASVLAPLKRPFVGAIWMWLIGSLLSQMAIYAIAPQDFGKGWFIYLVMTLNVS